MKKLVFNNHRPVSGSKGIFSPNRKKEQKQKQTPGSVTDRYPVVLDNGRTVIWITDRSKEREIRERYAS